MSNVDVIRAANTQADQNAHGYELMTVTAFVCAIIAGSNHHLEWVAFFGVLILSALLVTVGSFWVVTHLFWAWVCGYVWRDWALSMGFFTDDPWGGFPALIFLMGTGVGLVGVRASGDLVDTEMDHPVLANLIIQPIGIALLYWFYFME